MMSITDNILRRIQNKGRGSVHTVRDFLDMGTRDAVDQSFSRLQKRGKIRRIIPGIYDYPRVNDALGGRLSPNIYAVANAIARKNCMRIMISGAQAANNMGLSTQVPAKIVYWTDGPSRKVSVGGFNIIFKHACPKRMSISQTKSVVILQALKYMGKNYVDDAAINQISRMLSDDDKRQLSRDVQNSEAWLIDIVKKIAGDQNG